MANRAFSMGNFGEYLRHYRVNNPNPNMRTQIQVATHLRIDPKKVSKVECGEIEPDIALAAEWCIALEWYEGCDLLSHAYGLDPLGLVPVDPALNQNVSETLHNLRRQLKQALAAVEELIDNEPVANRAAMRGTYQLTTEAKNYIKEVADVIPAIKSYLYAADREDRAEMREIGRMWNIEALTEQVAMPRIDQLEPAVAAR
ncbi:hypothetical protein [Brevibacillus choshinensis]|uniref:hypothetical protein n=1 Tax=Brevibacillus choshinensis TaxID=54911 RepID=UPI002E229F66|nr:hypothetical protein [Brevibacillus choshinensis]